MRFVVSTSSTPVYAITPWRNTAYYWRSADGEIYPRGRGYSHSIVAGGLLVMSYRTRVIPGTSRMIRLARRSSSSSSRRAQSAVMPSSLVTARMTRAPPKAGASPVTPTVGTGSSTAKACQRSRCRPAARASSETIASAARSRSRRSGRTSPPRRTAHPGPGRAAPVVVRLDPRRRARAALDDVGVERPLHQDIDLPQPRRLLFKDPDELLADDASFHFGIRDATQPAEEALPGVHVHERDAEGVAEGGHHLRHLPLPQQPAVHEAAGETVADGPVHQGRGGRGIHTPGERDDRPPAAHGAADLLH